MLNSRRAIRQRRRRPPTAGTLACSLDHVSLSHLSVTPLWHASLPRLSVTPLCHASLSRLSVTPLYHASLSRLSITPLTHLSDVDALLRLNHLIVALLEILEDVEVANVECDQPVVLVLLTLQVPAAGDSSG